MNLAKLAHIGHRGQEGFVLEPVSCVQHRRFEFVRQVHFCDVLDRGRFRPAFCRFGGRGHGHALADDSGQARLSVRFVDGHVLGVGWQPHDYAVIGFFKFNLRIWEEAELLPGPVGDGDLTFLCYSHVSPDCARDSVRLSSETTT